MGLKDSRSTYDFLAPSDLMFLELNKRLDDIFSQGVAVFI